MTVDDVVRFHQQVIDEVCASGNFALSNLLVIDRVTRPNIQRVIRIGEVGPCGILLGGESKCVGHISSRSWLKDLVLAPREVIRQRLALLNGLIRYSLNL